MYVEKIQNNSRMKSCYVVKNEINANRMTQIKKSQILLRNKRIKAIQTWEKGKIM
jgi:hypothetical protein